MNGKVDHKNANLKELDETATLCAAKVHSRIPEFLRKRCPKDLQPHWVWSTIITCCLKRISCLGTAGCNTLGGLPGLTDLGSQGRQLC
jgi:hypothetical protein